MRILDRYIFRSVFSIFISCIFVFVFLYVIIDIFSHLEDILRQKVSIELILRYYFSFVPMIFVQVSPVACLLSVLYTFGRLNRENEIIAMRSSGLSILQISRTAIIFGFIITVLVFLVSDKFVPHSSAVTQKIKARIESGEKQKHHKESEVLTNLSMYGLKNRLFFINKFSLGANTMEGIIILEHDEKQNITKKIVANRAAYKDGVWVFYQSITYNFDENGQIVHEPQYLEEEIMPIPETPKEFLAQRQLPENMTIQQLDEYIWRLSRSGATTVVRNLKVDLYNRYASPFTAIIIMLLGIPFSLKMKKRATGLSSIGLSIMVGFLYYVLSAVCLALGKAGVLMPALSASLAHIIALVTALHLINTLP